MTPNEYQKLAQRTECDHDKAFERLRLHHLGHGGWPKEMSMRLLHSVIGMMGELGELAGALEKWLWYGQSFDDVNFKEEIGDANWYQAEAMNALGAKFEEILQKNIEKLKARYPDKYSDEKAANRNLEKERQILEKSDKTLKFKELYSCSEGKINLSPPSPDSIEVNPEQLSPETWTCCGAGFIEPPEDKDCFVKVPEQSNQTTGLDVEYPKKPDGTPDSKRWSFGTPTEPGNYEWFSPIHSLDPSKITIYENYSGIAGAWGRDVYYRKLPAKVEWKFGTPTEDGDYVYYYPQNPEELRTIYNWKVEQGWGVETYYRKITGSFLVAKEL